jgi:hypothetical protein
MSQLGQKAKYSLRADVFRSALNNGHRSIRPACPFGADSVAKVFLSHQLRIFRAVGAAIEY